jgi:Sec-independent protein translocase protein TatA
MPFGIGYWEIALGALVIMLLFGPQRFPHIVRSLRRGANEIKRETQVFRDPLGALLADDERKAADAERGPAKQGGGGARRDEPS